MPILLFAGIGAATCVADLILSGVPADKIDLEDIVFGGTCGVIGGVLGGMVGEILYEMVNDSAAESVWNETEYEWNTPNDGEKVYCDYDFTDGGWTFSEKDAYDYENA